MVDVEEGCDDGNDLNTDACTAGCVEAVCGDGFIFVDVEACDDGNADNTDTCTDICEIGGDTGKAGCGSHLYPIHSMKLTIPLVLASMAWAIFAGSSSAGYRDDFYHYDPTTHSWTELEPFLAPPVGLPSAIPGTERPTLGSVLMAEHI